MAHYNAANFLLTSLTSKAMLVSISLCTLLNTSNYSYIYSDLKSRMNVRGTKSNTFRGGVFSQYALKLMNI
jgi:hypothetical protein